MLFFSTLHLQPEDRKNRMKMKLLVASSIVARPLSSNFIQKIPIWLSQSHDRFHDQSILVHYPRLLIWREKKNLTKNQERIFFSSIYFLFRQFVSIIIIVFRVIVRKEKSHLINRKILRILRLLLYEEKVFEKDKQFRIW